MYNPISIIEYYSIIPSILQDDTCMRFIYNYTFPSNLLDASILVVVENNGLPLTI